MSRPEKQKAIQCYTCRHYMQGVFIPETQETLKESECHMHEFYFDADFSSLFCKCKDYEASK